MQRKTALLVAALVLVVAAVLLLWPARLPSGLIPEAGAYDVRILRDTWGVPHVFGLWTDYLPFDRLAQVLNPPSGFGQNCDSSPFQTTTGEGNPERQDFAPSFGIETRLTNRSLRALELLGGDDSITLEVPLGEVQRLRRGGVDLGVGGGPDVLRAVYSEADDDGRLVGLAGDSYVLIAAWDAGGRVSSRSVHQYGSATRDQTSPHHADQAELFVRRQLKPVWLDEAEIRANLEREYRPGEVRESVAR